MPDTTQPIRIGVIGVRGRGGMARHWHEPGGRSVVTAGMDVSDEALDAFKNDINPDARLTKSCDELVAMDDLDAVAVMSPEFTHEEYVLKAFAAGKHVFCEKPMAITTDGCDRMLRAWRESGKRFMVGFNMRYMNIFRAMKDIVDSGTIGEVKVVWVRHFVGHGGRWYYHDWHANSDNTTGLLLQKASHDIDMIHWITGRYGRRVTGMGSLDYYGGDRPDDLVCPECDDRETCVEYQDFPDRPGNKMNRCVFRREVDVEDNSSITMELDGGIKATYTQCHYTPDYCRNYTFIGTEGRVENLNDSNQVIVKLRDKSNRWKNLADRTCEVKPASGGHGGADPLICRDFIDMIVDGKKPLSTPLAGRMSVAVGCAATHSIRNGSVPVEIEDVPQDLREDVF
jgi:predicted dehydrogenase